MRTLRTVMKNVRTMAALFSFVDFFMKLNYAEANKDDQGGQIEL